MKFSVAGVGNAEEREEICGKEFSAVGVGNPEDRDKVKKFRPAGADNTESREGGTESPALATLGQVRCESFSVDERWQR